jgi:hypothetical protein
LRACGHDVVVYDPGAPFHRALSVTWTAADRDRISERLVQRIKEEHANRGIDVLFAYFIDPLVDPGAISSIRDLGIFTINYYCNGAHQFELVETLSSFFDVVIATDRRSLEKYISVGAKPIYMQLAANPELYKPYDITRDFSVTFVGQRYADRPEYIAHLLRNGVDVKVWGPGWANDRSFGEQRITYPLRSAIRHPRTTVRRSIVAMQRSVRSLQAVPPWDQRRIASVAGPSLPFEEMVKVYSRSQISLGFSACGNALYRDQNKILQIHLRDFEGPMSGAFYMVQYQQELEDFYEIGNEIICYSSREEMVDLIKFYLSHPDALQAVRSKGLARATADHSWINRFQSMFSQL